MEKVDNEIFDPKKALSDNDLERWCKNNGLVYHIIDLQDLPILKTRISFVFTGDKKDDINKGHDHHWIFVDGDLLFDSYGREKAYEIPKEFTIIENNPTQLQEFNSVVCGQYCAAAYKVLADHPKISDPQELGELISDTYGFTSDRRKNDELVHEWFRKTLSGRSEQAHSESSDEETHAKKAKAV